MEEYSKELMIDLYRMMLKIRLCEEHFVQPILNSEVKCPVHLYSGEEAIAAGVCRALTKKDYIFGGHRSHGHFLAKGGDINSLVAEVYGKNSGCSKGRGGSMHLIDPSIGMLGAAPIVGGTISLALGAALAVKINGESNVSVCFFGDGATGEGVLFESLNFASLHRLPILFVCENNLYSTHMPIRKCRKDSEIYKVAEPFGIHAIAADGNNVMEVYQTATEAVDLCRKGDGPVFIEHKTYRLRGHVGPDDNIQGLHTDIRPKAEYAEWKLKDPIYRFEGYLLSNGILTKVQIIELQQQTKKVVKDAFLFATSSEYPDKREVMKYVFK